MLCDAINSSINTSSCCIYSSTVATFFWFLPARWQYSTCGFKGGGHRITSGRGILSTRYSFYLVAGTCCFLMLLDAFAFGVMMQHRVSCEFSQLMTAIVVVESQYFQAVWYDLKSSKVKIHRENAAPQSMTHREKYCSSRTVTDVTAANMLEAAARHPS